MTGINKRSNDPKSDQSKLKINPLYSTFAYIKAVADKINEADKPASKKRK